MAQEIINIGTTDDDRTGDELRAAFDKINNNTTELYGSPLTNVVNVNSLGDFPDPVDGIIELIPNALDEITYVIAADTIDCGLTTFSVTDGNVIILGMHRIASRFSSSTTGDLFTATNSTLEFRDISFLAASARLINFTNPGGQQRPLVMRDILIVACGSLGTIDGAFSTSLRVFTVLSTTTSGFTWTGSTNNQINMSNVLGVSWAGTLFDLGTATFNIISMGPGNRLISPTGTTIISGLTGSGNINTGGRALVSSNIFNGTGTALSGITTQDDQWDFTDNVFEDGTTMNTRVAADAFLTASTTVTISVAGTYVAVGGVNWSTEIDDRFSVSTAGLLTYIGLDSVEVIVTAVSTVEKVGGGADQICTKIAVNGTVSDKTIACTENSTPTGVVSQGLFTMTTNDTMQLFCANITGVSNVIVSESNVTVVLAG